MANRRHGLVQVLRDQLVQPGKMLYRDQTLFDLNKLIPANSGWVLEDATEIDSAGRIIRLGEDKGLRMNIVSKFNDLHSAIREGEAPAEPGFASGVGPFQRPQARDRADGPRLPVVASVNALDHVELDPISP